MIIGLVCGWTVVQYEPLIGSLYIESPESLRNNKRGLIDIRNCKFFTWCLLAHKFPIKKDPQRVIKYKKRIEKVDFSRGKQHPYNKVFKQGSL